MGEADMQGKDTSPVVTEAAQVEALYPISTVAPPDGVMGDEDVAKGMIITEYFEGEAKRLSEEACLR